MSHGVLHLVTVLCALTVFAVGVGALLGLRHLRRDGAPGPITFPHMVAAGVLMLVWLFIALQVAIPFGLKFFGVVRLLYVNAVVTLPLGSLFLLIVSRRVPITRTARGVAIAGLLAAPLGAYMTFVEPYRVQLETAVVTLPEARTGSEPLRIGVLSDIQTFDIGEHEHDAVDRLMAEKPDLVLLPGDFIHPCHDGEREAALPALRELLRKIDAPFGAYAVPGDVESPAQLRMMLEGTPITPLVNETARVEVKGRVLTIVGLNSGVAVWDVFLRRAQDAPGDDDVRILMTHRPDPALDLDIGSRFDLVVAGHTHGGQVVVPFFGPPITLSHAPRRVCAGGLHELLGNRIYVSRGLGWEHGQAPRMRFLAPPEITVLELR